MCFLLHRLRSLHDQTVLQGEFLLEYQGKHINEADAKTDSDHSDAYMFEYKHKGKDMLYVLTLKRIRSFYTHLCIRRGLQEPSPLKSTFPMDFFTQSLLIDKVHQHNSITGKNWKLGVPFQMAAKNNFWQENMGQNKFWITPSICQFMLISLRTTWPIWYFFPLQKCATDI